ncbi:MAG: hypothetical protein JWR27_1514 [Aeromicrobium sp.]|nr:hypothetical protein [Aeromicrobium sp.]
MGDLHLPLLTLLLVVLAALLVLAAVKRRRPALADDGSSDVVASREQGPVRRAPGRHSAVLPVSSGGLLRQLVPLAVRRGHLPDVTPRLVPTPTDPVDDVAVLEAPVGREQDMGTDAVPRSSEVDDTVAAAEDVHLYRRRVNATIQAMSRRIEPGEPPELVEARMLAAVDRLDGPVGFVRPTLSPSGPPRSGHELGPVPQTESPASPVGLPSAQVAGERDVGHVPPPAGLPPTSQEAAPTEELEAAEVHDEASLVEDAEVVLPVPPLPPSDDPRRRGLRRRGKAG